jgi:hypothetical protein
MNRYFKLYRDSMKRLHKLETIVEEVYVTEKEPGPMYLEVDPSWKMLWYTSRDSDWDQWVDIDMESDEPSTSPPKFKVTTALQ